MPIRMPIVKCWTQGTSARQSYRWIDARGLPAHKIGRLWKFRLSEVDAWVEACGADQGGHQKDDAP